MVKVHFRGRAIQFLAKMWSYQMHENALFLRDFGLEWKEKRIMQNCINEIPLYEAFLHNS